MVTNFTAVKPPPRKSLHGRYIDLEPLNASLHGNALYEEMRKEGIEERFMYTNLKPHCYREDFDNWISEAEKSLDPLFFAVVCRGRALGRLALLRFDTLHGVIEIGHIMWGPSLSRTRSATEAFFLCADWVFNNGYRRLEWKCDNQNEPSQLAAKRFGFTFEGVFRQHLVVKGRNRDTAWFSIIDREWPALRKAFVLWLSVENFDERGLQILRLQDIQKNIIKYS